MGEQVEDESVFGLIFLLALAGAIVASLGKVSGRAKNSGEQANICASVAHHLLKHLELSLRSATVNLFHIRWAL